MQSRKLARIIALVLAFILVLTFVLSAISSIALAAPSESKIERLNAENDELSQKIVEVEAQINSFDFEKLTILEKKAMLDELVLLTDAIIVNLYAELDAYDAMAEELQDDLLASREREKEKLASATNRIRAYEENGVLAYISLVFESETFAEFLGRVELMRIVLAYDNQVFGVYSDAKEKSERIIAKIDGIEAEKERVRQIIEEKEIERDKRVSDAVEFILEIESSWETYELLYTQVEAEYENFEHEIASKTAEQIRLSPQIQPGTGALSWPLRSGNTVILGYGTKLDTSYNIYRVHNGIDIGGEYGAEVCSADSGMVTATGYDPIYGNYIVINHGNGIETLYAQLSVILVEEGEQINKDIVIAQLGASGYAGEPHLHFEIRVDGESDNPLRYFSGYTIR